MQLEYEHPLEVQFLITHWTVGAHDGNPSQVVIFYFVQLVPQEVEMFDGLQSPAVWQVKHPEFTQFCPVQLV